MKNDGIDQILKEYVPSCADKMIAYYSMESQEMEAPSVKFLDQMERLSKRARWKETYHIPVSIGQRIAAAFIVFLLAGVVLTFSVEAVRDRVVHWFTVIYEDYILYQYDIDGRSLEFVPRYPAYLPEGYRKADEFLDETQLLVTYENQSTQDSLIITEFLVKDKDRIYENSEFDSIKDIMIYGNEATIGYGKDGMTISWTESGIRIIIDSTLQNEEELLRISKNLKPSE